MLGIFLDLETNGLDPFKHRPIEIAFKIIDLYTDELKCAYEAMIALSWAHFEKSDKASLQINGFTFETLSKGKNEKEVAFEIEKLFNQWQIKRGSALFICQNPSFDRGFFSQLINVETQEHHQWPYHWLDFASMYWALHIRELGKAKTAPLKDGLSKDEIARRCNIPPEATPHRAMNGVNHLLQCYRTVVGMPKTAVNSYVGQL